MSDRRGNPACGSLAKITKRLAINIAEISRDDRLDELGALKELKLEDSQSKERFQPEVNALQAFGDPALLHVLEADVARCWMVTEYHPGGTRSKNQSCSR